MSCPIYEYDVFLSYSSKDQGVVRAVAQRLKEDGLKVWFDEWEIKAGDSIPAKIEEGLEQSRVLVLCMSAHSYDADWFRLESGTFRFRDPLNKDRRFIPLRLDDAPIKGSLGQFSYINWLPEHRDQEYPKLLEACRRPEPELSARATGRAGTAGRQDHGPLATPRSVYSVAWSPDGQHALSGSDDTTVRLWEVESGRCLRVLEGHTDRVWSVAWSPDGQHALSGSDDKTVRLWEVESGRCLRALEGHSDSVYERGLESRRPARPLWVL